MLCLFMNNRIIQLIIEQALRVFIENHTTKPFRSAIHYTAISITRTDARTQNGIRTPHSTTHTLNENADNVTNYLNVKLNLLGLQFREKMHHEENKNKLFILINILLSFQNNHFFRLHFYFEKMSKTLCKLDN